MLKSSGVSQSEIAEYSSLFLKGLNFTLPIQSCSLHGDDSACGCPSHLPRPHNRTRVLFQIPQDFEHSVQALQSFQKPNNKIKRFHTLTHELLLFCGRIPQLVN